MEVVDSSEIHLPTKLIRVTTQNTEHRTLTTVRTSPLGPLNYVNEYIYSCWTRRLGPTDVSRVLPP